MQGVPFRSGGEATTAVLNQTVHLTFESITILLPLIRDGKLRALAITSRERTPLAPDLPTMVEAGVPDYEVTTFNGILAPAGTPDAIVKKLNAAMNEGLGDGRGQGSHCETWRGFAARVAGAVRPVHRGADHQMAGCREGVRTSKSTEPGVWFSDDPHHMSVVRRTADEIGAAAPAHSLIAASAGAMLRGRSRRRGRSPESFGAVQRLRCGSVHAVVLRRVRPLALRAVAAVVRAGRSN